MLFDISGALASRVAMGDGGVAIIVPIAIAVVVAASSSLRPADRRVTSQPAGNARSARASRMAGIETETSPNTRRPDKMPKTKIDKRSRLIEAAVELAYRQGFRKTTLADVSVEAKVPLGNVYYYFKTKDAIGEAILHHRLSQFHRMRDRLDKIESPKARLLSFVQMTVDNRAVVARRGCPMGSLCAELLKDGGALAEGSNALFAEPMDGSKRNSAHWEGRRIRRACPASAVCAAGRFIARAKFWRSGAREGRSRGI